MSKPERVKMIPPCFGEGDLCINPTCGGFQQECAQIADEKRELAERRLKSLGNRKEKPRMRE